LPERLRAGGPRSCLFGWETQSLRSAGRAPPIRLPLGARGPRGGRGFVPSMAGRHGAAGAGIPRRHGAGRCPATPQHPAKEDIMRTKALWALLLLALALPGGPAGAQGKKDKKDDGKAEAVAPTPGFCYDTHCKGSFYLKGKLGEAIYCLGKCCFQA